MTSYQANSWARIVFGDAMPEVSIGFMTRPLPSAAETARILATKRTRPVQRPPPTAARTLNATLKALEAKFGPGAEGLKARWSEIVGTAMARRTEPVKLTRARGGEAATLELRVEGAAATLIAHQTADILARVNLYLGDKAVGRLRIVQGPLRGAAKKPGSSLPPKRRPRGPLDAQAEQSLAEGLAAFPDDDLNKALLRLGREVLRGR